MIVRHDTDGFVVADFLLIISLSSSMITTVNSDVNLLQFGQKGKEDITVADLMRHEVFQLI